jgi:phage protein U
MIVGTWGDITFETSSEVVRTFEEIEHIARGRWAIHEVMNGKPRAEFLGPGQNEITLPIKLSTELGVDPRAEYEKIGTAILQGRHAPFILGPKVIGNGEWYAEENESIFKYINGQGVAQFIEMTITLREYF